MRNTTGNGRSSNGRGSNTAGRIKKIIMGHIIEILFDVGYITVKVTGIREVRGTGIDQPR